MRERGEGLTELECRPEQQALCLLAIVVEGGLLIQKVRQPGLDRIDVVVGADMASAAVCSLAFFRSVNLRGYRKRLERRDRM